MRHMKRKKNVPCPCPARSERERRRISGTFLAAPAAAALLAAPAMGGMILTFTGDDGLAGEAEFTLDGSTTLNIRLRNTSTGAPDWFNGSDQILTSLSWSFGDATSILGGTAEIGGTSLSLNFDKGDFGPGTDVSGEWGYGNSGTTGLMDNFISTIAAETNPFGGDNLDGPISLNGPQGGLVADPLVRDLGDLGAIQTEILVSLMLSDPIPDLSFLEDGAIIEFGSDSAFVTSPAPSAIPLLVIAGLATGRRRRRSHHTAHIA